MAGFVDLNRDFWQLISNTTVSCEKDLIKNQLNHFKKTLTQGLGHYRKPSAASKAQLSRKKVATIQLNFIEQLSNFLDLDELQCFELYSLYLIRDYRGPKRELQEALNSERRRQLLMVKLRDFYYGERIYLLRCLIYIISFSDPAYNHQYYDVFKEFVASLQANDNFVHELVKQYIEICEQNLSTRDAISRTNMIEKHDGEWLVSNLREQCELLELLLIYYSHAEHQLADLVQLLQHFKKQGFGRWQSNKRLMDETTEPLLARIGFLQVLIVIEAMELESLTCDSMDSNLNSRIKNSGSFKGLDSIFLTLGDAVEHGPLLLMWSVVRQLCDKDGDSVLVARKLGNRAIQLRMFEYLNAQLATEPFSGKTAVAGVCRNVIYGLLSAALNTFQLQSLGDVQFLHQTAINLLDCELIAGHFWSRGTEEGLMILLYHALDLFPLEFHLLIKMLTVLAKASRGSASEVVNILQNLTSFSETFDRSLACEITNQSHIVSLSKDRAPYHLPDVQFVIRRGTLGNIFPFAGKCSSDAVHWNFTYDGWKILAAEVRLLLNKVSYGAGAVQQETVHKVILTCGLLCALLKADHKRIQSDVQQLEMITNDLFCIVQRFCVLPSPSIDLLTSCLEVFTETIQLEPVQVWHRLQQTGFLPSLAHKVTNITQASRVLNSGPYGAVLAGSECVQGRYPVTQALLQLLIKLIEPLHSVGKLDELLACVLFICQEIFPVIYKCRYYEPHARERIGQKCLNVFLKILKTHSETVNCDTSERFLSVRDVVVHNLLFAESSHTLLDIIGTGVDTVEATLASQVNALEGAGDELVILLKLALSVTNQLLMAWPEGISTSPVAQTLSARHTQKAERHLVSTVAHYIYHRHNSELPAQATLLLKNLSLLFPMSVLSCLGNEAEAIRDVYLLRLKSGTESISLKVFTLEWLSICVQCQPGIIELFLNIQLLKDESVGQKEFGLGRGSCLQTVLDLIEVGNQRTYRCPPELLCAVSEFFHSLWKGRRQTAMTVLRNMKSFWGCVCQSLMNDLPLPSEADDIKLLTTEVTNCSHIFRILSLEIYHADRKVDSALETELHSIMSKDRLLYWSKYLGHLFVWSVTENVSKEFQQCIIQMLLAWREFLVVLSSNRVENVKLKETANLEDEGRVVSTKSQILLDILNGLESQFQVSNLTGLNMKLTSVASSLYLMVLKHWYSHVSDYGVTVKMLMDILMQTCSSNDPGLSSVQTSLLASLIVILQHTRTLCKPAVETSHLLALFPVVCELLQRSVQRLTVGMLSGVNTNESTTDTKYKLLTNTVYLLKELIWSLESDEELRWLLVLKQFSVIQCLSSIIIALLQTKEGTNLIQAALLLFIDLCRIPEGADLLLVNGISQQLCVLISKLYRDNSPTPQANAADSKGSDYASRCNVYRQYMSLMSAMLEILQSSFIKDALDFVGVHQERLHQCLDYTGSLLTDDILREAEESCYFLARLAKHRREWRLHLPGVLQLLMSDVCAITQKSVSLLIQPRLLQFLLDKKMRCQQDGFHSPLPTRQSVSRHLLQQSSVDETECLSPEMLQVQYRLLNIVSYCFIAMRHFSPDLCEVIMDQMMDVSPYDQFVSLGFSAPTIDQDSSPTFGTFIAVINLCLKLLSKIDGRPYPSPLKSSTPKLVLCESPVTRPVVMFVLENALFLIMSQSMRFLRDPNLTQRDKQLLKRELGAELNSCLISIQRHLRCATPTSSAAARSLNLTTSFPSEHSYFKVVDIFVKQILK